MKTNEIAKKLLKAGFEEIGGKKHDKYRHPDGRYTVLSRGTHELSRELVKEIEKQTGISLL